MNKTVAVNMIEVILELFRLVCNSITTYDVDNDVIIFTRSSIFNRAPQTRVIWSLKELYPWNTSSVPVIIAPVRHVKLKLLHSVRDRGFFQISRDLRDGALAVLRQKVYLCVIVPPIHEVGLKRVGFEIDAVLNDEVEVLGLSEDELVLVWIGERDDVFRENADQGLVGGEIEAPDFFAVFNREKPNINGIVVLLRGDNCGTSVGGQLEVNELAVLKFNVLESDKIIESVLEIHALNDITWCIRLVSFRN